jgi:hypothetical protein
MGSGQAGPVEDNLSGLAGEHCVESSSEVVVFESVYNDRLTLAFHSVHFAPTSILLGFGCSDLPRIRLLFAPPFTVVKVVTKRKDGDAQTP